MMYDYNRNIVQEGNYMIKSYEKSADFYQVVEGNLQLYARWRVETGLIKTSIDVEMNNLESKTENNERETFMKSFWTDFYKRMSNPESRGMHIVDGPRILSLLKRVKEEEKVDIDFKEHICLIDVEFYNQKEI